MTRKLLNKNINCFFLDQPLAENLQPIANSIKHIGKVKRLRTGVYKKGNKGKTASNLILPDFYKNTESNTAAAKKGLTKEVFATELPEGFSSGTADTLAAYLENQVLWSLSKKDRIEKAETQIVQQFLLEQKKTKHNKMPTGAAEKDLLFSYNINTQLDIFPYLLQSIEQIRNTLVSKRIQSYTYSVFKSQLREAKKIRFLYGNIAKRDLKKATQKAKKLCGFSGDNLLTLLESRLDVTLERCAFFSSIQESRQSVSHGRIKINGKVVNIPGYQLKAGDVIKVDGVATQPNRFNTSALLSKKSNIFALTVPNNEKKLRKKTQNNPAFSVGWRFTILPYIMRSLLNMQLFALLSSNRNLANQFALFTTKKKDIFEIRRLEKLTKICGFLQFGVDDIRDKQRKLSTTQSNIGLFSTFPGFLDGPLQKMYKWINYSSQFLFFSAFALKIHEDNKLEAQYREDCIINACATTLSTQELFASFYINRGFDKVISTVRGFSMLCKGVKQRLRGFNPSSRATLAKELLTLSLSNEGLQKPSLIKQEMGLKDFFVPQEKKVFTFQEKRIRGGCEATDGLAIATSLDTTTKSYYKIDEKDANISYNSFDTQSFDSFKYKSFLFLLYVKKFLISLRPAAALEALQKSQVLFNGVSSFSLTSEELKNATLQNKNSVFNDNISMRKANLFYGFDPVNGNSSSKKKAKPLHLEICYKSLCIVFLYPPQRVYLPGIIDIDLLTKRI